MNAFATAIFSGFVFYLMFHGSVAVFYDLLGLLTTESQYQEFLHSPAHAISTPFVSFVIPCCVTTILLAQSKSILRWQALTLVTLYSLTLVLTLGINFGGFDQLAWFDIGGMLTGLFLAWATYPLIRNLEADEKTPNE